MNLTAREQQIVAMLRRDPMIGSAAIAEQLGTTRAAVNVHLSNLGKKGVILGRGYLLSEQPGVVVIGGANVDIKARSTAPATQQTSNPGHGSMTPGGVARNIAENLARLGTRTHLIAAVGRDALGDSLLAQTSAAGVRLEFVQRSDRPTGTYTAILDSDGELIVAVADMEVTDDLRPEGDHRLGEERGASQQGLDQADLEVRSRERQHQPGEAGAASDVTDGRRVGDGLPEDRAVQQVSIPQPGSLPGTDQAPDDPVVREQVGEPLGARQRVRENPPGRGRCRRRGGCFT